MEEVNDATRTLPIASAQAWGPPISSIRSRAVPADRVSFHSSASRTGAAVVVQHHHAVLLARHGDRVGALEQAGRRGVDRVEPGARVDLGAGWVGGGALLHHGAVIGVHQHGLGRLGGGVDAEDESHVTIKYETRTNVKADEASTPRRRSGMCRERWPTLLAMFRVRLLSLVLAAVATLLSGCDGDEPTAVLLVADASDTSSRAVDVDAFTERVEATCDECRVTVYDAEGDAEAQKRQVRQAEADGADVLVVVPVEPDDLGTVGGEDLPTVSLGTLVPGSDRFVGLEGGEVPRQSGSDLEAAREVLSGDEESMTYVPTRAMSEQAADLAVAFLAEAPAEGGEEVDGVDSWLFRDQDVTIDSLTTVLVGQGVVTLDDLCAGDTAKRCARLGLR